MVQGQIFLKEKGGWGGIFPIQFFQGLSFLHLEITLCKIVLRIKPHSKLSQNEPENVP